ncbi:uncharacterized protein TNCV_4875341 [Trichonephila clavipes]|nr:uncharacterized protein TNCV_4875341 [Trichonephila clavipes]
MIVRLAQTAPMVSLSTIQRTAVIPPLVPSTISRRLAETKLRSRLSVRCLPLSPQHITTMFHNIANHLEWCRSRLSWLPLNWHCIVFSNESCFILEVDDRLRVWRGRSQRSQYTFVLQRHIAIIPGVMVRDGAVNTQNFRKWRTSPPNIRHQQPLHSDYVTAWCGFTAEFILGPFFFETLTLQDSKRCSVTSSRYNKLFQQHAITALQE